MNNSYFSLLPKELLEEIIYYVHVIDLSKTLHVFKSLTIYDYTLNKFLWNNYVKRYKFLLGFKMKDCQLNFIHFYEDINYKAVYEILVLKEDLINCWNKNNKFSTLRMMFISSLHEGNLEIIKFLFKHDEIESINPINIINERYSTIMVDITKNNNIAIKDRCLATRGCDS